MLLPAAIDPASRLSIRTRIKAAIAAKRVHAAPEGRPAYPPLTTVKAILLRQRRNASDAGMEEALQDRLSFPAVRGVGALSRPIGFRLREGIT